MPNHLADQLSPYLLQHAGNPVDWRPWGPEALELARRQHKPIFLSIGYASCHWCHVMAHESFEAPEIARLLNEHFVSIKVDRQQRPDLDMIYMEAVQAMTGRGGWPMSMFLTPAGEPFFGGTYWPVRARGGMPGFDQVLQAVADAWQHRRAELVGQAGEITRLLRTATEDRRVRKTHQPDAAGDAGAFHAPHAEAAAALRRSFDARDGGFGPAPKFPQPLALRWLLRRWRSSGDPELLHMVTTTLDRMSAGGIFDQLGGGFHRYTVDARWLVPHFEKMLYDNALLAVCYLEAWQATGREQYAAVVRRTLDYLLRDMTDPLGGFYSGEDADSEGEEGKFYLWTPGEIEAVLGPEGGRTFCRVYDVTGAGNFEGRNILNLLNTKPRPVVAPCAASAAGDKTGATIGRGFMPELADAREKLLAVRSRRVRPGRDEMVLVSWNSLAIDALAQAGAALDQPRYTAAAHRAAEFLLMDLRSGDGRLLHCWRAGQARQDAFLDGYAGLANALLTLHETAGQPDSFVVPPSGGDTFVVPPSGGSDRLKPELRTRLDRAVALADEILARFADPERGGFFFTASDSEPLILRSKDAIDNPVPSGNGLAAMLFARLAALTGRDDYRAAAEATFRACLPWIEQAPTATFQLLLASRERGVSRPVPTSALP